MVFILAKYLFITADDTQQLHAQEPLGFLRYILERIHLDRDIHFHTNTTIDTLDYSGTGLNSGSKVVFAAYGDPIRILDTELPSCFSNLNCVQDFKMIMPGVAAFTTKPFVDAQTTHAEMEQLNAQISSNLDQSKGTPLLIWCDDATFTAKNLRNFLWVAFTRCNPSHDMYGIGEIYRNKHWGCEGLVIIDARIKPHHAPAVELDPEMVKKTDRLFAKGGSLEGVL